jgi:hypothetical protein
MRSVRCLICLGIVFAGGLAARPQEKGPPPATDDELRQLQAATVAIIKYWERMVAKELRLRDRGASSDHNVYITRDGLALTRHELAVLKGEHAAACEQLRAAVRVRDEDLRLMQRLSSQAAGSAFEVGLAQIRLANARCRMAKLEKHPDEVARQLQTLIGFSVEEEKRLRPLTQKGAATAVQMSITRCQGVYARYRLALEEGRLKDALANLKLAVEARSELLTLAQKEHGHGYLVTDNVDYANALLLRARVRVAVLERNPERVRGLLRELVAVSDRFLHRIGVDTFPDPDIREGWAVRTRQAIAFDRYRLTLIDGDLDRVLDDPLGELEWLL